MLSTRWPVPLVVLCLGLSIQGCAFLGRQTANNQSSSMNPFAKPNAVYVDQSAVEEEEEPAKEVTDPNALKLQYALWMEETGNLAEARLHYSEVLKARPKDLTAALGVARVDLASEKTERAEQGFRRAIKIDETSALAHSGLGQCQALRKEWSKAVDELTEASKGLPEDKTIRYHLAVALVHTGDLAAAQVQFTHCVDEAAGHYNTALILKDEGQLGEAERQLELALRKNPNFKDAERWLVEVRRARYQAGQATLDGPPQIKPSVKQVTYRDLGYMGTAEIQPAVYVSATASTTVESAGGHSIPGVQAAP